MADESGPVEQISFLTRSKPRVQILTHLLETGPTTQRAFRDHLDVSRSTITRALSALEERDWVSQDSEAYRLTPPGRIIADGLADLVETIETTDELSTFLEWFPIAEYDLTLDQLRDATITASTEPDPYAPSRKHAEALEQAGRFRNLLPSIDLQLLKSTHDRLTAGEMQMEIVIPPEMEATITAGEYASVLREQVASGNTTVFVSDQEIPFYLGLHDESGVHIGVEDDEGYPRALLETDDPGVREWAEAVYADHRERARRKPVADF